jgi:hypothetical protein
VTSWRSSVLDDINKISITGDNHHSNAEVARKYSRVSVARIPRAAQNVDDENGDIGAKFGILR